MAKSFWHVLSVVTSVPDLSPRFDAWLSNNWAVWRAFEAEADRLRESGRSHYSARAIIHWLRHETAVASADADYKINDHCSPDLARLYMALNPGRDDLFELRVRKSLPQESAFA